MDASGAGRYKIDLTKFSRRLKALYSNWRDKNNELWGSSTSFFLATPPFTADIYSLKSSALSTWLLGYVYPNTVMIFTRKQIHFLCSPKKALILDTIKKSAKEAVNVDVVLHVKGKHENGLPQIEKILLAVKRESAPLLGYISIELVKGKLFRSWMDKVLSSGIKMFDISNALAELLADKDFDELQNVKNAAYHASATMNVHVVPKLETIIAEDKKITHASLMKDIEDALIDPSGLEKKLEADAIDIAYRPVIQSGWNFDLGPSAVSNCENLTFDTNGVIICSLGSRYNRYCANVARTLLLEPNTIQCETYELLLKAHEAAIDASTVGNKASDVYMAAYTVVEKEAPHLIRHLTKSAGTGMGLEFCELGLNLTRKNDKILQLGMVLNVSLGFENLPVKSSRAKSQKYALLVGDTVIVTDFGGDAVTSVSSKALKDVAYSISEENDMTHVKVEAQLLADGSSSTGDGKSSLKTSNDLFAYTNLNNLPAPRDFMIVVDPKNEAILLPIYGCMVPFHIATVTRVIVSEGEGQKCYLRILFSYPAIPFGAQITNSMQNQDDIFLKEILFCSKDLKRISEVAQQIKTLRSDVVSRRSSLVNLEKVVFASSDESDQGYDYLNAEYESESESDESSQESDKGYEPSEAELDGDETDGEEELQREEVKMKASGKSRAGPSSSAPKRSRFKR